MSEDNTIAYPEWTKKGYRDAHEGDGLVMMRPFRARGTVQPQQCPTIMTGQGGGCGVVVRDNREPTIPIKEDTEQGYADAHEGDGVKLFTSPGASRGVVQSQRSPTLVTYGNSGCGCGVVVRDDREPCINIVENTKRGFKEAYEGDGIKLHQQIGMSRGIVQSGKVATLVAQDDGCGFGVVVKDEREVPVESSDDDDPTEALPDMEEGDVVAMLTPGRDKKRQNGPRFKPDGTAFTINCQDRHGLAEIQHGRLRIRYLTPRECWRLMGQPDWAYDRVVAAGTPKTHLYKQAGNSIVVDVLEAIFKGMYIDQTWEDTKPKRRMVTLDDFGGEE